MINLTQGGWHWEQLDRDGFCPQPDVEHSPATRISALLWPDGEPLRVPYPRVALGFDLRPRGKA